MNTDQLRYLIEISKSPSISVASERLHLSTPALSTAIKRLEDELGYSLLQRSHSGTSLTEDGQNLVEIASRFLEELNAYNRNRVEHISSAYQGTLNILLNYSGSTMSVFAAYICTLEAQFPSLQIHISEIGKSDVFVKLEQEAADLGFVFRTKVRGDYVDMLDSEYQFIPFLTGELNLLTSPKSCLADLDSVSLKRLVQFPVGTYAPQDNGSETIDNLLQSVYSIPVTCECCNSLPLFKERLLRGHFNSISVKFPTDATTANYVDGCKVIPIWDDIQVQFGCIYRKNVALSASAKLFIDEFQKFIPQYHAELLDQ